MTDNVRRSETVVVLGASNKPDRYAYKALVQLREHGHRVIPVHPKLGDIDGVPVVAQLGEITEPVNTVTLYVGPERLEPLLDALIALHPARVIANPGTESPLARQRLGDAGIDYLEACTLVLLRTRQF